MRYLTDFENVLVRFVLWLLVFTFFVEITAKLDSMAAALSFCIVLSLAILSMIIVFLWVHYAFRLPKRLRWCDIVTPIFVYMFIIAIGVAVGIMELYAFDGDVYLDQRAVKELTCNNSFDVFKPNDVNYVRFAPDAAAVYGLSLDDAPWSQKAVRYKRQQQKYTYVLKWCAVELLVSSTSNSSRNTTVSSNKCELDNRLTVWAVCPSDYWGTTMSRCTWDHFRACGFYGAQPHEVTMRILREPEDSNYGIDGQSLSPMEELYGLIERSRPGKRVVLVKYATPGPAKMKATQQEFKWGADVSRLVGYPIFFVFDLIVHAVLLSAMS
eukprot:PhM_4_TR1742/c0_g1_i1/m.42015